MERIQGFFTERRTAIVAFVLPALTLYLIFVILPIFQSLYFSFFRWEGVGPLDQFIGLANFRKLLSDPIFWQSLFHNFILVIASLITELPLALILAILLTGKTRGKGFFRTVFFAPMVISTVASGYLWRWIYNPIFGLLNGVLNGLGLGTLARGWLGDSSLVLMCIIVAIIWRHTGFYMVLFMAAIEGIPEELYEAAQIDGASSWQLTRYITVPLLAGPMKIAAILVMVGSIKYFDLIWVMTHGGPGHASELVATYMYKQTFQYWRMGYGASLASTLFLMAFVASIGFLTATARREEQRKSLAVQGG